MNRGLFQLLKLAAPSIQEKLDQHFDREGDGRKWATFRNNLRSKGFANAAKSDARADDKLRRYVEMNHLHKTGKGPTVSFKGDSGKRYHIKYHESINRYSCSCPDWTIKRSTEGGDCKHISELKSQVSMVKHASLALKELAGLGRMGMMAARKESNDEGAWHAGQVNKAYKTVAMQRKIRRG